MKILVILSRVPYPLEKGDKLRAYHQLKELRKNHEIILCCLTDTAIEPGTEAALKEICQSYHIFHLNRWKVYLNLFLCLFSRKPFQVMYFYQKSIHKSIKQIIDKTVPDHIFCQLIRTAEYAKNEHNYTKTLDYQDAFSKGMERRKEKSRWPLKEIFAAEHRRLIGYENIIFEYFEGKTIISEEDRRYIYHPERKDIAIVTNGIDTDFFRRKEFTPPDYDLLFTGNMGYAPNIETAEFIVNQVLPIVRKVRPQTTLLLAGSAPHRRVKALARHQGVEVSGWMDDIRDAYSSARIFLAPMQIGTGLQNKLLEAMAMELPCITSSLANKPLKAEHKIHILVGDTAEDLAAFILNLLVADNGQAELGRQGRIFVETHFSWLASTARLEETMVAASKTIAV